TINSYHMDKSQTVIYWAGALFNHKELIGNMMVAKAVENVSDGRYIVKLPQDFQTSPSATAVDIRNADLTELLQCDALVANFDGADLDSGTVVEFCVAKALDMPTVLLRTDFRNSGDADGIPWNLMCAGWPRTEILWTNSLADYHRHPVEDLSNILADKIIHSLDKACAMKPWLTADDAAVHFRRTIQSIGGGLEAILTDETIAAIVERKRQKGLLA
ncbi:MAG: nucleoside 2-deoxyribosyltransferase, partial [Victivallales bacterium]|nr:nucleoside 2-deoxyribosyltransferase [Victivallales bacterium]